MFHQLVNNTTISTNAFTTCVSTFVRNIAYGSICCHTFTASMFHVLTHVHGEEWRAMNDTHSLSASATVHLYCAVENRQMSANCLTDTLILFTVRLLLFAICTFTAIFSPWWYNSLSSDASKWSLFGDITNSLLTSTEGCSPCFDGAYIIFRMASRTELLQHDDSLLSTGLQTVNPRCDTLRLESYNK